MPVSRSIEQTSGSARERKCPVSTNGDLQWDQLVAPSRARWEQTGAGVLGGRDLAAMANITLGTPAQITGSSFLITVPLSVLPSLGLDPLQYGFNLWPRDASVPPDNAQISDFAPDDTTFNATAVQEPSAVALVCAGMAMLAGLRKHLQR